jgi:uncharacterized membrane protein
LNTMQLLIKIKRRFQQYFLSGLLLVAPIAITYFVITSIFVSIDNLLLPFLRQYFGDWLPPGIGLVIVLLGILLIGILVTNFIGNYIVRQGEKILLKIPIAKTIYTSAKQILSTFSFSNQESFKKVVLVEYPKENIWSIGFVNGAIAHPVSGRNLYSILILTSINPASGFFIMVPIEDVVELKITVEEAMKWIISGGIITPHRFK